MNPFQELGISENLVKGIEELGFTEPTEIQEKAIPELIGGTRDFVGLAQTGTGKTAAFGLPLLHNVDDSILKTQSLVIAPTRELGVQIAKDLTNYSKFTKTKVVAVYGGASIDGQIKSIKRGAHVIVATPGRLLDLIKRRVINTAEIKQIVLDEADEMLNMGFQQDIDSILASCNEQKNVWLFSATMPAEVQRISENYMTDPFKITVGRKNSSNENIEHQYYVTSARNKYPTLKRIVDFNPDIYGVVFCKTKRDTQEIAEKLIKEGYNADALHGDLSQSQRDNVMKRYRDRSLQLLIATDVAARGIDVKEISHVIHYGLPQDVENYTHRSGRTGRAGSKGISICIADQRDGGKIRQIERMINTKFIPKTIPTGEAVLGKQFENFEADLKNTEVDEKAIEAFLPIIEEALADVSKEELIKKITSSEFSNLLSYYKVDRDLNESFGGKSRDKEGGGRSGGRQDNPDEKRIFVNLGRDNNLDVGGLIRVICDNSSITGNDMGRIDLFDGYSFIQVHKDVAEKITSQSGSFEHDNREVRFEVASPRTGGGGGGGGRGRGGRSGGGGSYRGGNKSSGSSGGFRGGRGGSGGDRDRGSSAGNSDRASGDRGNSGGSGSNNGDRRPRRRFNRE